jgi:hypothetical protein
MRRVSVVGFGLALLCAAALPGLFGCNPEGGGWRLQREQPVNSAADTDIFRVLCFYPANMWKSYDPEGDPNPEGFAFVMYLMSRDTGKGVFADGTFRVELYRRGELGSDGRRSRDLVFDTWAPMSALPRRSRTMLGHGYQPYVDWGELDIFGADIEIVVKYESPSGRIVPSETVNMKVPARKV